jgi:hypothetical protein
VQQLVVPSDGGGDGGAIVDWIRLARVFVLTVLDRSPFSAAAIRFFLGKHTYINH